MSLLYCRTHTWTQHSRWVSPVLSSGKDYLPHSAGNVLPSRQSRIPLAFTVSRADCWLMSNLAPTRTPRSFSAQLLPDGQPQACTGVGLCISFPRCRTLCFFFWTWWGSCQPISPVLRMAVQPSSVSATPPGFVLSALNGQRFDIKRGEQPSSDYTGRLGKTRNQLQSQISHLCATNFVFNT